MIHSLCQDYTFFIYIIWSFSGKSNTTQWSWLLLVLLWHHLGVFKHNFQQIWLQTGMFVCSLDVQSCHKNLRCVLNGTSIWPIASILWLSLGSSTVNSSQRGQKKAEEHLCFDWSKVKRLSVWLKMAAVLSVIICWVLTLSSFPASPLLRHLCSIKHSVSSQVFWHHFLLSFRPLHLSFSGVNCVFFGFSSHTHDFSPASHCDSVHLLTTIAPLSKLFYFLVPENSTFATFAFTFAQGVQS